MSFNISTHCLPIYFHHTTNSLLKYINDPDMRRHIQAATTKVESFNNFSDWVIFGGPNCLYFLRLNERLISVNIYTK